MPVQLPYNHPHYQVRRYQHGEGTVAAGTATPGAYFRTPQAIKFHAATIFIMTAGTVTSACQRIVKISGTTTTTLGTATVGTGTANSTYTMALSTPSDVAAGGRLYAENVLDATMVTRVAYEFKMDPSDGPAL